MKLIDRDLEAACALEAVLAFDRYLTWQLDLDVFGSPGVRDVVQAAHDVWEAGEPGGLESVGRALQRSGKLANLGGAGGLAGLLATGAVPDPDRLRELAELRGLRETALSVARLTEQGDLPAAQAALSGARDGMYASGFDAPVTGYELGLELFESLSKGTRAERLVHPGLDLFEEAVGQLALGSLTIFGAHTNVGKTSVAIEMLLAASARQVRCGYVSCEDPRDLITAKELGSVARVSSKKLVQGTLTQYDFARLADGMQDLKERGDRLLFSFGIGANELDVCSHMTKLAMRGCRLIVVDYLQAIEASERHQDRRNEIRKLMAKVRAHGKRLDVALIVTSQFSRPTKGDEFKEPTRSMLKEAGDIENMADGIVLAWRESNDDWAPIYLKVDKGKLGNNGIRWQMQRDENARLVEVPGSLQRPSR